MAIYFVSVTFKQSGRTYYYCARASSKPDAARLAIGNRGQDVDACEAFEWPSSIEPLIRHVEGSPHSFPLRSPGYIERVLTALTAQRRVPVPLQPMTEAGERAPTFTEDVLRPGIGRTGIIRR